MAPHVPDLGRRVRAARCYAGFSMPELAEKLEIGRTTQWRSEVGERTPKQSELRQLAYECDLPVEFFYADFSRLAEISDPGESVERELQEPDQPSPPQAESNGSNAPSRRRGAP